MHTAALCRRCSGTQALPLLLQWCSPHVCHCRPTQLCTTVGKFGAALVMESEWNELLSRVFQWAAPVSPAGTQAAVQAAAVAQTCAAGLLRELGDCIVLRHPDKLHFFVQLFERLLRDRAALPFAVRTHTHARARDAARACGSGVRGACLWWLTPVARASR